MLLKKSDTLILPFLFRKSLYANISALLFLAVGVSG
jgi:hypothetical protein